jgi:hypothetical protein
MSSTSKRKSGQFRKYAFEFVTVFAGVTMAFLLSNWNENRNNRHAEEKILTEISKGLAQDTADFHLNINGHQKGLEACSYFRNLANGVEVSDSLFARNFIFLLRDFISVQNKSGYESLKSKGLELIEDDDLRNDIISIYDFQYQMLEKLEEEYEGNQFYRNYFDPIQSIIGQNFIYSPEGKLIGIRQPLKLSQQQKNELLLDLYQIEYNRNFTSKIYHEVDLKVSDLIQKINSKLED